MCVYFDNEIVCEYKCKRTCVRSRMHFTIRQTDSSGFQLVCMLERKRQNHDSLHTQCDILLDLIMYSVVRTIITFATRVLVVYTYTFTHTHIYNSIYRISCCWSASKINAHNIQRFVYCTRVPLKLKYKIDMNT